MLGLPVHPWEKRFFKRASNACGFYDDRYKGKGEASPKIG